MKVILLQNVNNVGTKGEVKDVSDGFAMNYLLARKLAAPASDQLMLSLKNQSRMKEVQLVRQASKLADLADRLKGKEITVKAKTSDKGTLYKAIGAKEISLEIKRQLGYNVDVKCIRLDQPIKIAGEFSVKIKMGDKETDILIKIRE